MRDLRAMRLPAGELVLMEQPPPDADNTNAAVTVVYQVCVGDVPGGWL
jgi:hypothetical protein